MRRQVPPDTPPAEGQSPAWAVLAAGLWPVVVLVAYAACSAQALLPMLLRPAP